MSRTRKKSIPVNVEIVEIKEDDDDDFLSPAEEAAIYASYQSSVITEQDSFVWHEGVQCDSCGLVPIVGPRWKCTVRKNFDLCAECEAKDPQPHPMMKILVPEPMRKRINQNKKDSMMTNFLGPPTAGADSVEIEEPPVYSIERSKSGRAECKRCDTKIGVKEVRVGLITEGSRFNNGLFTRWQHLKCTVFHKSIVNADSLDGFAELDDEGKELVRNRVAASANEIDQELIPVDPDELVRKDWTEAVEPTNDLLMPLLPYQKEGLGWMLHQESCEVAGGILADEMGMGKTIQAISLILSNKPPFTQSDNRVLDKTVGTRRTLNLTHDLIVLIFPL